MTKCIIFDICDKFNLRYNYCIGYNVITSTDKENISDYKNKFLKPRK